MTARLLVLFLAGLTSPFDEQLLGTAIGRLQLDKRELRLSDELRVVISIEGTSPIEVDVPTPLVDSTVWRITPRSPKVTPLPGGRELWQQEFRLAPLASGAQRLTFAPIRFRTGQEVRDRLLRWRPQEILVTTDIEQPDLRAARGVWGFEPLPPQSAEPISNILWLVLLAAGLGLAVLLWRWLRRREAPAMLAPEEQALRRLREISPGTPTATLAEMIATCLRLFLQERLGFPASHQTTGELLETLRRDRHLGEVLIAGVEELLRRCDRAKFAREAWDDSQRNEAVHQAERLIQMLGESLRIGESTKKGKTR